MDNINDLIGDAAKQLMAQADGIQNQKLKASAQRVAQTISAKTTEAVFRFFANGYRREHGTEPEVTGNRKLSERDILSGMRQMLYDLSNE